jgi:hypothetical protein
MRIFLSRAYSPKEENISMKELFFLTTFPYDFTRVAARVKSFLKNLKREEKSHYEASKFSEERSRSDPKISHI